MNSWRKAIIKEDSTLEATIKNLTKNSYRISLVVDSKNYLIGTVVDGDIRRALINGLNLKSSIKNIINRKPIVALQHHNRSYILDLMVNNKVNQIPIVNENNILVGLSLWDQLNKPAYNKYQMIIMAGGKGTRLKPHTTKLPKSMVKVSDKPILEHIIERAKSNGFNDFTIAINHLGHIIEEYFKDGNKLGVKINYIKEKSFLGTAGAISLIKKRPKDPFVITNGDVLTDIDYSKLLDFHNKNKANATIAVRLHEIHHPFGVIETNGIEMKTLNEKPIITNYINAGIYVLSPETLDELKVNTHCDMTTLLQNIKSKGNLVVVYPMHEPWLDIGRSEDLHKANKLID